MQVETPQQVETPIVQPVETPTPAANEPPKEPTIREHAESTRDPEKRRRPSDDARPEDREEIGTLTKRLREAEEATGIKRKPQESNRVYELRVRTELAERLRDVSKPKEPPKVEQPRQVARPLPTVGDFTEPEPTIDQFKNEDDPATAYFKALARYELKREQHETAKTAASETVKQHEAAARRYWDHQSTQHASRLETYVKTNPDARAKLEAIGDKPLSPIMFAALQIHEKSPELMMALATNPDLHDELFLLTDGRPVGDPTRNPLIGIVQRRLTTKAQTVHSPERSPASPWKNPAPPPSPVRTQPIANAHSSDTKDETSVLAHARKYHRRDD